MNNSFLEDKETRCIISLGVKGSGKTTFFLKYLQWALNNNIFEHYFLCIPKASFNNGQYEFLKNNKNITVFTNFNATVPKMVLERKKKIKGKVLFLIEDSTQYFAEINHNQELMEIFTCSRHLKITLWLILHASRRIMSVPMRSNIDYLFLFKANNKLLIDNLWEEFFSVHFFPDKKQFLEYYKNTCQSQGDGIFLNLVNYNNEYHTIKEYFKILDLEQKVYDTKKTVEKTEKPQEVKKPIKKSIFSQIKFIPRKYY